MPAQPKESANVEVEVEAAPSDQSWKMGAIVHQKIFL